jgi:signal transduction histidine kinase
MSESYSPLIGASRADQKEEVQKAEAILKLVDQTILSVRRIATELRPGILYRMTTSLSNPERTTAIFRIFQETLTNMTRHAQATQVDVKLGRENGRIVLEVRDNGCGIAEEQLSTVRSLGILGMRERAVLLGGELTISGAPQKGTTLKVLIPENA